MIQHILCPIDFSPASLRALGHAAVVANHTGASLLALHVFNAPLALRAALPQYAGKMLDRQARADLLEQLDRAVKPARDRGTTVGVRLREGDVVDEIAHAAESVQADLIVLGTHGRSGVRRMVLGSVTEKVLRRASCPVLTVPPAAGDADADATPQFANMLCCVDFSDESDAAFRFVLALVQEAGGAVRLIHVVDWPVEDEALLTEAVAAQTLRQHQETEVRARLEGVIPDDAAVRNRVFDLVVRHGKPYTEILRYAETAQTDLIVMGAGRRTVAERLIGSTTDRVIRSATCPVLTLGQ